MQSHPNVQAVQDALDGPYTRNGSGKRALVRLLPDAVHTAAAAAEALGVDVGAYDEIWAAGGVPQAVFPTTYAELLRVTRGTPTDVA
ncbi:YbaK/EbsC family protein [Micromonospora craniellae]|uniref:Uncharacterized protein n=1 Tax=Micromonospora craniellae TaxID=2294034 RepID=A0A372FZU1_9ACTN|nr:hypothetical protein [Micromonospora craniellae]QOC91051.1 hypothetical protein ID554_23835 [Micromonospora craniellae]RFS46036.1 hypothetical protein D0Q02_14275 [Micromonospora craniellae]